MVSAVDDGVGLLMNKLKQLKIDENTLVIFLSDNGGPEQDNASDNGELRGGKGSLFEGGIRVPFAMQWPGKIAAGTEYRSPVISLDIFATIAANVAGLKKPINPLDGVDLMPFLQRTRKDVPHDYLFWRQYDQKKYAVIDGAGMKALTMNDSTVAMYQLTRDISEEVNVAAENRSRLQQFQERQ
jgi:arylsulfatase A-like enzyme